MVAGLTGIAGAAASAGTMSSPGAEAGAVVGELRRLVAEHYVVTEERPAIERALAAGLAAGRYDSGDPHVVAASINADLEAAAHDKHLGLLFDPGRAASMHGRQGDDETVGPTWERMAQVRNHGFSEMKVLPGNVRYVALDGFVWTGSKTAAAYDHAMRFLKEGDAIIIDLRRNGGGSPRAVHYLASHFLEGNQPLVEFHMAGRVDRVSTDAELPVGRLTGRPLYVLTSSHSASAAEEFAAHVVDHKLGDIVGEATAGAAFRNDFYPIAGKYVLSLSVGRPVLAVSGGNWEGKGIAPTMASNPAAALEVAHLAAVRRLAEKAPQQEKGQLDSLATRLAGAATEGTAR